MFCKTPIDMTDHVTKTDTTLHLDDNPLNVPQFQHLNDELGLSLISPLIG
jgi:hypothetical protein